MKKSYESNMLWGKEYSTFNKGQAEVSSLIHNSGIFSHCSWSFKKKPWTNQSKIWIRTETIVSYHWDESTTHGQFTLQLLLDNSSQYHLQKFPKAYFKIFCLPIHNPKGPKHLLKREARWDTEWHPPVSEGGAGALTLDKPHVVKKTWPFVCLLGSPAPDPGRLPSLPPGEGRISGKPAPRAGNTATGWVSAC